MAITRVKVNEARKGYTNMENKEIYAKIVESYKRTGSVDKTAAELKVSRIKVRRVLITEELWSSELTREIAELRKQNLDTEEIAEKLHYSVKNIEAFSPYKRMKRGYGDGESSIYAIRSKAYRDRIRIAAQNQAGSYKESPQVYRRNLELVGGIIEDAYKTRPFALKVRVELDGSDCSDEQIAALHEYGNVNRSISREIIVPADISLHALHYAIQRLFGWQNRHPHRFEFPREVFDELTKGSFSRWCSLAGVYFRFPDDDVKDLYWDEDYEANKSIKTWLKEKYTGPYTYGGLGDYYFENQKKICTFKEEHPMIKVTEEPEESYSSLYKKLGRIVSFERATIDEIEKSQLLQGTLCRLLESLTLLEYLYLPDNDLYLEPIEEKLRFLEDSIGTSMLLWDTALEEVESNPTLFNQVAAYSTVRMQGQSDVLLYYYDDVWTARITILDAYYKKDIKGELRETLMQIVKNHSPVCVASDGLSVLDEVRGVSNFADFLLTINEDYGEDRGDYRLLAKSLGWMGRKVKPKNML